MSHQITIGATEITYEIRRSARVQRKRIEVTPGGVVAIAPEGVDLNEITDWVESRRRWLFNAVQEINTQARQLLSQRYASGAKLQYRGRWLMLDVKSADVPEVQITCRSKFHVQVPEGLTGEPRLHALRTAFDLWLKDRAQRAVDLYGRKHARRLDVTPAAVRLSESKHRWGSCGRDGVIRIHWRLIQSPSAALEYVVAHEVAHLVERNHSPEFWSLLAKSLPDWRERKEMLERWETDHRAV